MQNQKRKGTNHYRHRHTAKNKDGPALRNNLNLYILAIFVPMHNSQSPAMKTSFRHQARIVIVTIMRHHR